MDRMPGCINSHIWSEQYVIPDGDLSHIQHHTVGVGIKILPDFDMASVLTVERWLKIYVFLMFQSYTFQTFHPFFRVKRHGLIVLPDGLFCFFLLRHYCIIGDVCHFVISSVNIVHCKSLSYKYTLFSSKKCPVSPDAL